MINFLDTSTESSPCPSISTDQSFFDDIDKDPTFDIPIDFDQVTQYSFSIITGCINSNFLDLRVESQQKFLHIRRYTPAGMFDVYTPKKNECI